MNRRFSRTEPETGPAAVTAGARALRSALWSQAGGWLAWAVAAWATLGGGMAPSWGLTLALLGLQVGVALGLALKQGAPHWWLWIHALFAPALVLALRLNWPAWVWGAAFVLVLLVFWRTDRSRVPLYLSNARTIEALSDLLPEGPFTLVDLGCGDGRVLRALARRRPDGRFEGWEHAPLTWAWARLASLGQPQVQIRWGNFWKHSFADCDVVYAFLSPAPMPALWQKLQAELRPQARLVSNSFEVPGVPAEAVVDVADRRATQLWLYRPGRGPGADAGARS